MYNINFNRNREGFVLKDVGAELRIVASNNEVEENKKPRHTYYASTGVFSRRIPRRRPERIGKISK